MRKAGRLAASLVFFALTTPVSAAEPPDTLEERLKACAVCHGKQGEGLTKAEYYPRLAGKPAQYLFNQLVAFRDQKRRTPIMSYLVAYLSDEYFLEIAQYYEALKPPYPPPARAPADLAARGETLAVEGDAARGIPPCTSCHGKSLTGMQPSIPGLVGLSSQYIASQMGAWRIGQRQALEPDCMREIASALTPEDIAAMSAWIGTLAASPGAPLSARVAMPMKCGSVP